MGWNIGFVALDETERGGLTYRTLGRTIYRTLLLLENQEAHHEQV